MPTGVRHKPVVKEVGLESSVANCTVQAWSKGCYFAPTMEAMQERGLSVARFSYLLKKPRNPYFCVNFCKLN